MRDFRSMFPEMEAGVIEAVLRANGGAVDATIDQLLAMATDNDNERLRTELEATENAEAPPHYSPPGGPTPPPSYQQATRPMHRWGPTKCRSRRGCEGLLRSRLSVLETPVKKSGCWHPSVWTRGCH